MLLRYIKYNKKDKVKVTLTYMDIIIEIRIIVFCFVIIVNFFGDILHAHIPRNDASKIAQLAESIYYADESVKLETRILSKTDQIGSRR